VDSHDEYHFKIDAYTPETIPMARLAEYMNELAKLMANADRVHFQNLISGSTVIAYQVEREAAPKVALRVDEIRRGDPPDDARPHYKRLNEMLRDDNAVGELERVGPEKGTTAKILRFPGREVPRPEKVGPFSELTTFDGELVRIGGRDQTAHIQIQDAEGRTWTGELSRDLARELKNYLWEGPILRVEGNAKWIRTEEGNWEIKSFRINSYKILPKDTLLDVVERVRKIEGSEWRSTNDPIKFIRDIRKDDDEIH
jgi:hypothetical protein